MRYQQADEILREGKWAGDWTDAEAPTGQPNATAVTDPQ